MKHCESLHVLVVAMRALLWGYLWYFLEPKS